MSSGKKALVRAGPSRVRDALPASGPLEPLTKPKKLFECSLAQRVISGGETHVCQPSEKERKHCSLSAYLSWFAARKKEHCLPTVLLRVVEAFGDYADSDDVEGAQALPQRLPPGPSVSILFKHLWEGEGRGGEKFCSSNPRATSMICALCPSAFAVGRHFVTFPVLGLQVQVHSSRKDFAQ